MLFRDVSHSFPAWKLRHSGHGLDGGNRWAKPISSLRGTTMTTQTIRSPLSTALHACFPALAPTFVLSMFINASMLASPLYSMQIYDRVLTSRNVGTLSMLTLIVAMFLVLYGVIEFARAGVLAAPASCSKARCATRCSKP